jgi:hypothetical protein
VHAIKTIVGHLTPDLDCLTAIWLFMRFGGAEFADLRFVAAGRTLDDQPADSRCDVVHVDTGGGSFDHHHTADDSLSAAELVRRAVVPYDNAVQRIVDQVTLIDHALLRNDRRSLSFTITDLVAGYNAMYPTCPEQVVRAMTPNLDAWYEHERRQSRLRQAFQARYEFQTRWGLGIAVESEEGGSSRQAFQRGAVLFAYRDRHGHMGVTAPRTSDIDLQPVFRRLQSLDADADWYLHPTRRLLLCGTPKAPVDHISRLSLAEFVEVLSEAG